LSITYPLAHLGWFASVAILSVLAVVELVADKLPQTPSRTAPVGADRANCHGRLDWGLASL
jgi:uncharacterized membrane protein